MTKASESAHGEAKPSAAAGSKILVLGAYGFIGSGIVRHLNDRGFKVVGLGRNQRAAKRAFPDLEWIIHDLSDLQAGADWQSLLQGVGTVINCAGALQDGGNDRLDIVHERAIAALAHCCAKMGVSIVQISAAGAHPDANTRFLRTKAAGDTAIRESGARHWIIRPGIVLGRTAYGGTALLRMVAATPLIQPMAYADAQVQTVGMQNLAGTVEMAVRGQLREGSVFDLVEEEVHGLGDLAAAIRGWLGFSPARYRFPIPAWSVRCLSVVADGLGHLGWRSPLRSTAISAIEVGVTGDPSQWRELSDRPISGMHQTLAALEPLPADRLAARLSLLMPLTVATLFLFWLLSGIIGLISVDKAAATLIDAKWHAGLAIAAVLFWSVVDIGLAVLVLVRRYSRIACIAMVMVGALYLVAATATTPWLWLDPLGPLVKILPAIMLAIAGAVMLEER